MISLNIIPRETKKEIRQKSIHKSLRSFYAVLVILACLYSIVFLVSRMILHQHYFDTIVSASLVTKNTINYSQKVKSIKNKVNYVENVQSGYVAWSYLLEFLDQNKSQDLSFSQITVNRENGTISLAGLARTRDSLLGLKDNLENSEFLGQVDFPIKNLLAKENINFEISAKFNNYEFEQIK